MLFFVRMLQAIGPAEAMSLKLHRDPIVNDVLNKELRFCLLVHRKGEGPGFQIRPLCLFFNQPNGAGEGGHMEDAAEQRKMVRTIYIYIYIVYTFQGSRRHRGGALS